MLLNLSDAMLSREQLKTIKGGDGYGGGGSCYWSCSMTCGNGGSWTGAGTSYADYDWMMSYYCGSNYGGHGVCNPAPQVGC